MKTKLTNVRFSTILTTSIVFLFTLQMSFSQGRYKDYYSNKFIVGLNVIDDSFTKKHDAFNYDEEWNIAAYPSYFGYNLVLSEKISVEGIFTMNKYNAKKLVDGVLIPNERKYYAFDVTAKYNLSDLFFNFDKLSNFEPFVALGAGITSIEGQSRPTINYGFGTYIWFEKYESCCSNSDGILNHLGVIFQTMGKSSIDQKTYGNQIQHTFGIVYRF